MSRSAIFTTTATLRQALIRVTVPFVLALFTTPAGAAERSITAAELRTAIEGYWIGQLAGNYVGFPFENLYQEEPLPILVDRYYTFKDAEGSDLKIQLNDRRGYIRIMADALGGSWSDDDSDIEFVYLHAMELHGTDVTYEQIAAMWRAHINRYIWSAARRARDLMEEGLVPPATGSKEHNPFWYRITAQLMNEIFGVINPGMTGRAAERSLWGARILTDDWATDPTVFFGILCSAAYFEKDVPTLVTMGMDGLAKDSPFREGIADVIRWHGEHPDDWRATRAQIHDKYYLRVRDFVVPDPFAGSVVNGLCAVAALLHGDGDWMKTVGIATSMGYDCDNQAATCGAIMAMVLGPGSIPERLTLEMPSRGRWTQPFNNTYINYSRDGLPNFNRISDIVDRILAIAEKEILANGGSKTGDGPEAVYTVKADF
ncbi:MAG TPA: ADP-ribosylglycohydrolase family protein [Opitutaceae bacterium]|nr:ADP-ribosylglycohydrolase family protein [Opitutaceae bacterium]